MQSDGGAAQPGAQRHKAMPWFVRGDIDGLFGLAIDNLIQLLVIVALCRSVLGFPDSLIIGTILPGAAVSLVVGNVFYAWQAIRLSRQTGRTDICALPYGINTVSLFAFIFLVMLPASLAAKARGLDADAAALFAWQTGLVACFGAGVIELAGAARRRAHAQARRRGRPFCPRSPASRSVSSPSPSCFAPTPAPSSASPRSAWCCSPTSGACAFAADCRAASWRWCSASSCRGRRG